MIRWSHGHSLATGGLLGLALVRADLFLVLVGVFAAGLVLGRGWSQLGRLIRWLEAEVAYRRHRVVILPRR